MTQSFSELTKDFSPERRERIGQRKEQLRQEMTEDIQMPNMDDLFDIVTKTIASPHTTILEHDKLRAIRVFIAFEEFLLDNVPEYCGDTEFGEIDFGGYAAEQLDILEGK